MVPLDKRGDAIEDITTVHRDITSNHWREIPRFQMYNFSRDLSALKNSLVENFVEKQLKKENIVKFIERLARIYLWEESVEDLKGHFDDFSEVAVAVAYMIHYKNRNKQGEFNFDVPAVQ